MANEQFQKELGDRIRENTEADRQKSAAALENTFRAMLETELTELQRRIEDLETSNTDAYPIPQLTPNSNLADVIQAVNYVINYLNIGIKRI